VIYISKVNKIVQYDLGPEVMNMRSQGLSQDDIATQIRLAHPDIKDLENLSAMAINRFLKSDNINKYETQIIEGENPEDELRTEFRDKMYTLDDDTHQVLADSKALVLEAKKILEMAKTEDITLQISAIKGISDVLKQNNAAIEQTRRNWSTFVEQSYRQFGYAKKAKSNVNIQYNTLLIDISKELCPECRKKVVSDILKFESDNKE
jgi:transcriptional regulator